MRVRRRHDVSSVWLWANGNVMVFDEAGEQITDLQGEATHRRLVNIARRSGDDTEWHGFPPEAPLVWNARLYVCDVAECEKAFATMAEVIAHERTHRQRST